MTIWWSRAAQILAFAHDAPLLGTQLSHADTRMQSSTQQQRHMRPPALIYSAISHSSVITSLYICRFSGSVRTLYARLAHLNLSAASAAVSGSRCLSGWYLSWG